MNASSLFDLRILDFFKAVLRRGVPGASGPFAALAALNFQRRQAQRRQAATRAGHVVPPVLIASITRRCNLDCTGCYSKALRPGDGAELSDERFMELFSEAVELGVGVIMLAGGEPLLRRSLLEKAAGLPGVFLPVFTNGTLIDEGAMDLFARSRLVPIFSIEGESIETAERRGAGVHESVLEKAAALRARGGRFGLSITLTSRNFESAISRPFLEKLEGLGASALFLIEYVPVAPGTEELVLTAGQKALLAEESRFAGLGYGVVQLPGDEEDYGGCLAAGRGFIHLAADGRLEACPFAPFSDSEAGSTSLAAALDSPLMREIRARHAELTETRGGCALWNKRGWVASLGSCLHSADEQGAA
ncbi:MAG TPA: radical SAM/SPASM domain-containing protein [Rectinemataceae bacterium]|nr:radical SAM/SPASM domain-containing protein [Rectinemataceae bacterium]